MIVDCCLLLVACSPLSATNYDYKMHSVKYLASLINISLMTCLFSCQTVAQITPDQSLGQENSIIIPEQLIKNIPSESVGLRNSLTLKSTGGPKIIIQLFYFFDNQVPLRSAKLRWERALQT